MASISVDKLSLKELIALEARLHNAITEARAKERSDLKKKVAELAASHGFSVSELLGAHGASKTKGVAKYANPDNPSDTWTGRGRKPLWLVARLKKGATVEDFSI